MSLIVDARRKAKKRSEPISLEARATTSEPGYPCDEWVFQEFRLTHSLLITRLMGATLPISRDITAAHTLCCYWQAHEICKSFEIYVASPNTSSLSFLVTFSQKGGTKKPRVHALLSNAKLTPQPNIPICAEDCC